MTLNGKTALVTGGGTGIGAAIARSLAQAGCRVAITGRRPEKLRETANGFDGEPAILAHASDMADRGSVAELFARVGSEFGQIDILVNSAGINVQQRSMADLSAEDWDRLLQVNATGAYNAMREVLPQMRERKDGLIVNISSVAGRRASVLGGVAYSASKFAMTALGMTVAEEERLNGIRVTTVFPGEVETPILDDRPVPVDAEHRARILQPEDIATSVLMVAQLHPRAHIPELVIIPTTQSYV